MRAETPELANICAAGSSNIQSVRQESRRRAAAIQSLNNRHAQPVDLLVFLERQRFVIKVNKC